MNNFSFSMGVFCGMLMFCGLLAAFIFMDNEDDGDATKNKRRKR